MEPVTKKIKLEPCEDWSVGEEFSEDSQDFLEFSDVYTVRGCNYIRARQAIKLSAPLEVEEVRIVQEEFQACVANFRKRLAERVPILQEDLSEEEQEESPVNSLDHLSPKPFWDYIVEIPRDPDQEELADIAVQAANNPLPDKLIASLLKTNIRHI